MIAHLTMPMSITWEHGLREIDMLEVDTEHPPIDRNFNWWRRVIEGPESLIRKAVETLIREGHELHNLSCFDDEGNEITPDWHDLV